MVGNITEMISDKGFHKRGSWDHSFEECKRTVTHGDEGPDPRIRFRVYMEVIE